jgi:cell division topological specificity factor
MLDFITKFFKREEASKTLAKERLRLVLMSDRVSLAPDVFDEMKGEMLDVIRRYLEIDERALDMHFENLERQFALLASIPVLKVKSADEIAVSNGARANGAAGHNGAHQNGDATSNGTTKATPPRRRRRRRRSTTQPAQDNITPPETPPASDL